MAFSSFIHPSVGGSLDIVNDEIVVTAGDRVNTAQDLQHAFLSIAGDGFCAGIEDDMRVVPDTPATKNVLIMEGFGWVRGVNVRSHDGGELVTDTVDNAAEGNPRIDLLVVRHDPAERAASPAVLQGTNAADPVVPTVTKDPNGVWEVPWAELHWPAGATALHESEEEAPSGQGWIVDRRLSSASPLSSEALVHTTQLASNQASVDLPLPGPFPAWRIGVRARCDHSGTPRFLVARLLPDAVFGNYDRLYRRIVNAGETITRDLNTDSVFVGILPTDADLSTAMASGDINIERATGGRPTLKGSTHTLITGGGNDVQTLTGWGVSRLTGLPTGVRLTPGGGNFTAGSRFAVHVVRW